MRTRMISAVLAAALWSLAGCGAEPAGMQLALHFGPRDLPAGTTALRYYVLHGELPDGTAVCEDFLGREAPKSVLDYTPVATSQVDVVDLTGITVVVDPLEPGDYLFYIEAMANASVNGCGCGTGAIAAGEKTVIPIRLVSDCRI